MTPQKAPETTRTARPLQGHCGLKATSETAPSAGLLHLIHCEVEFFRVASKSAMSMVLLAVLLTGMVVPAGACGLMCARHQQAALARHCVQHIASMPGMNPEHSRMNSPVVASVTPVLIPLSCEVRCAAARLSSHPRVVPQVTSVQTEVVVLKTATDPPASVPSPPWRMDGTPPAFFSTPAAASFNILRI